MWILTPSLTSRFAAATAASTSASNEQLAEAFAQSLMWRSSRSRSPIWLQRLRKNSWTKHLCGAICDPSLGESFTDWWTSSLAATRANPSAQPANASAPKTHDTSGRLSQPELLQCDQVPAFLKTSTDISRWGFPTFCKTWQDWVTERRGAWRARVNAARLTRGKGSSSWPTVTAFDFNNTPLNRIDGTGRTYKSNLKEAVHQNWPSPVASEVRQGFQDRSKGMKGSQESLTTVVIKHGQAAPASSSTHGSRQGLRPTPEASQGGRQGGSFNQTSWKHADGTPRQPSLAQAAINQQVEMVQRQELWLTPRANEPDSDPNFAARNADRGAHCHGTLSSQAKETWWTPQVQDSKHSGTNPTANGERDLLVNQVNWATPQAHDAQGPKTPEQIAVMRAKGHGVKNLNEQAQWGTPTARDHKSGRGNEEREYKELTPMVERTQSGKLNPRWVETLMGLPIGWTMPSCIRPVTIERTSCDSSAMALCQPAQSERSDFLLAS